MNNQYSFFEKPNISPILDNNFKPAVIENKRFIQYVLKSGKGVSLVIYEYR